MTVCVCVQVKFSMLEIYNEVARDLLDSTSGKKKIGLKIRQHPKRGFYGILSGNFYTIYGGLGTE